MKKTIITSAIALALNLSACSEQKTAEQFLVSGDKYSQQGQYANAIIDFKNAVRLKPKDANARLGLGNAYLNRGNYISAEKELVRAVDLGADFTKIAPLLAQVKTRLDKFSEVEQLVKASEDLEDSDYLVILTYAGMSALTDGKMTKAQDYFAQAAAIKNNTDFSQLANAYLLYSERNFTEGLQHINRLLESRPNFAEASLLQGYLKFATKDFEQASKSFNDYLSAYPLDYNIHFFLVNTLIKASDFKQAKILTDKLLANFKKSPLALQYKAQLEYQAGNYIEAREYASRAISIDESFIIAKMIAGVSSYKLDELEQAYDYLVALENMLPATHPINVILLSVKIKLGHTDDLAISVAKLNEIQNSDSDSSLLQITSLELMKAGDYASAQSLVDKAEQVSPSNAAIKVQRGAFLLNQRDLSGVKSLEQALSLDPSLHDTEFVLARQYIRGNETDKAQAIADKWFTSEQYQVSANILSGLIASQKEDVVTAEAYFKKALILENNNISALYNLALLSAYKKQAIEAIAGFKKVIELNPNHHNAIRRYSVLQTRQGQAAEAISFLSTLHEQSKLNGGIIHKNLVIGLAQNLRINKQGAAAIELLETIQTEQNLPARYWSVLADSYKVNLQFTQALTTYEMAVKVKPNSYMLRVGYIGALEKLQHFSKALTLTTLANKDFPHDENLMVMLAYLELANNNVQAAKKQLQKLNEMGISNHVVKATSAQVAMQEKEYVLAITLYTEIYKAVPKSDNAINLARAFQFSEQSSEAEQVLEKHLTNESNDNRVRMLLAELYDMNNVDNNKSAKIIASYQAVVKAQPNVAALNNLAWQQYQVNSLIDAQQSIEKAVKLQPNNLALQESYGVILVANKKYQQAIDVLTNAAKGGSIEVNAKVSLAEAYIANEQPDKAKEILVGLSAHDSKLNVKIAKLKQLVE